MSLTIVTPGAPLPSYCGAVQHHLLFPTHVPSPTAGVRQSPSSFCQDLYQSALRLPGFDVEHLINQLGHEDDDFSKETGGNDDDADGSSRRFRARRRLAQGTASPIGPPSPAPGSQQRPQQMQQGGMLTALLVVCQLLASLTNCPNLVVAKAPPPLHSPPPPSPIAYPPPLRSPPPPPHPAPAHSPSPPSKQLSPPPPGVDSPPGQRLPSQTGLAGTGMSVAATPQFAKALPNGQRYAGPQFPNSDVKSVYEVLPQLSNVVAVHLVHVPGTSLYLYMERPSGYHPIRTIWQIAGTFNLVSREWTPVNTPDGLFCCGHTVSSTGQVVIVGGHRENAGFPSGLMSVRVFDPRNDSKTLIKVTEMGWKRWYPTPTLLPDSKVMIMGGTQNVGAGSPPNPEYEIFTPSNPHQEQLPYFDVEPTYLKRVKQNYYPFNYVLPTGDVFNFCNRWSRILHGQTGLYLTYPNGDLVTAPDRPGNINSQFPFTATSVMLPLSPDDNFNSVEVVVFGGAPVRSNNDITALAGRWSHRITISWTRSSSNSSHWEYTFSDWVEEDMGIPRVMGDATLLPNGDVILLNGAQTGCAGDSANGGNTRASYPTLWAQLYQPDQPRGKRYTTLAASTIARLYHSTAALTVNGTVLVTGCDRCSSQVMSDVDFINLPPVKAEYRNEMFYPPYWYDDVNKPRIEALSGSLDEAAIIQLGYGEVFNVSWSAQQTGVLGGVPVTGASLVAPSATTHSFNTNQRVVRLEVVAVDRAAGQLQLRTPPHPNVAPPQMFMLFLLNGKTYGAARWVQLVDRTGLASSSSGGLQRRR